MPTYRTTARNQFRSPSGAVGEAPDGPGAMATMLDDVDNILGVGGAEYCANAAAVTAIPAGRRFAGKLAYQADAGILWRYVGNGGTGLAGNDTTHPWQAWEKPATPFTPSWVNLTIGSSTVVAQWGISAGTTWMDINAVGGTSFAVNATLDVNVNLPSPMVCGLGTGTGLYVKSGGSTVDLACFPTGTTGQSSSQARLRGKWAAAAPGPVTHTALGTSIGGSTASDSFQFSLLAPSALVA